MQARSSKCSGDMNPEQFKSKGPRSLNGAPLSLSQQQRVQAAELTRQHYCTDSGFTLIEFVVAIVIIGIGAALLTSFITPTAGSADPMIQAQARSIATGYMDEILLAKPSRIARTFRTSCRPR